MYSYIHNEELNYIIWHGMRRFPSFQACCDEVTGVYILGVDSTYHNSAHPHCKPHRMIINPPQGETAMLACKIYNLGNKSVRKVTHSVFLVVILLIHQMQLNPFKCLHVQLSWKWSMETIIISKGSPWWHWTQMCTAGSHLSYIYNIYFMDKKSKN